jgi:hypothetical protein
MVPFRCVTSLLEFYPILSQDLLKFMKCIEDLNLEDFLLAE